MANEPQLSTEDSMKLIQEMIGKARRSYVTKGIANMVWGSLIIICSIATWAQVRFKFYIGFDVWLLLIFALVLQIYFAIKEKRAKDFVGHDEQTMNFVRHLHLHYFFL